MLKQLLVATALGAVAVSAHAAPAASANDPAAAATAAATPAGSLFVPQVDANDHLASRLIGTTVYDNGGADAQSIGEVKDLVLGDGGSLDAVIVGVGGFLGMGEKDVAISYSSLQWGDRDGSQTLVVTTTKEELEAAPAIDISMLNRAAAPATDGTSPPSANNTANRTAAVPLAEGASDAAASHPNGTADQSVAQNPDGTAAATAPAAGPSVQQTDVASVSANDLLNTTVYSANDENVGEVGDVILADDGKIDAVVLDVGGFLGIGEKPVAIAFDALDIRKNSDGNLVLYTRFTKEQLDAAATYDKDNYAAQRDTMRLRNPS